jgi:hypothetical protein
MNLTHTDDATDLQKGDIVFIKFEVLEPPTNLGDVRLRYYARRGADEYAAKSVNSIFIKRPKSRLLKRIINKIFSK